jgi:N utilization substance protein B
MSSNKISTKTISRIAAIQTLYQYQLDEHNKDINLLIQEMVGFYQDEKSQTNSVPSARKPIKIKLSISHFNSLVKTTVENLSQIDEIISNNLMKEWKITNLSHLLRAILRIAICELKFFPEISYKVVVNEFTDITSDMLGDKDVGFVNSILDKVAVKV